MGQSATMSRFVGKPESRSAGKPESRSGLEFNVTCLPYRKLAKQSITFLTRYRSGGTPLHHQDVRAGSFAGRRPRDQGPPAVLGASRLFVLLVAARRWVLAGNTTVNVIGRIFLTVTPFGVFFICNLISFSCTLFLCYCLLLITNLKYGLGSQL